MIWEKLVYPNVFIATFLFLTLNTPCTAYKPTVCSVCQHPRSVCFVLITTLVPRPGVFEGCQSNMAFYPPRIISRLGTAILISVFCLSGQCLIIGKDPGLVWETAMPLPSIYPAYNVSELTLVSLVTFPDPPLPVAGDLFQVLRIFFFQIETNLGLLELKVHASCA